MWCKFFLLLFFVFSCQKVEIDSFNEPMDLEISLSTKTHQEPYSVMKYEFEKIFNIRPSKLKCNLSIAINYYTQNSGIASTAFAINQTLVFTTVYSFQCNNGLKIEKPITLTNEFTIQQEKTMGQYVGEKHFLQEISKRMAKEIYDDISLFIILNKTNK